MILHPKNYYNLSSRVPNYTSRLTSSGGWTRFDKKDCPVCGGERNDCREKDGLYFCRGQNVSREFVYFGEDRIGFSMYRHEDDVKAWKEEKRQEFAALSLLSFEERNRRQRKKKAEEKAKKEERAHKKLEGLAKLLSEQKRDRDYRKVIQTVSKRTGNGTSLTNSDREKLKRERGLTDEMIEFAVAQGYLASWEHGIEVEEDVSRLLPGINPKTRRPTTVGSKGIAILATNPDGQITGAQIAKHYRDNGVKYPWLSSSSHGGSSVHLQSGEWPLFYLQHPKLDPNKPIKVVLVEGALKALIAALLAWFEKGSYNCVFIGASSGNFAMSKSSLKTYLKNLQSSELEIVFCPDGGAVRNKQVLGTYRNALAPIISWGYSPKIAWWEQFSESDGDIDEISIEKCDAISYITPEEFFELGKIELEKIEPKKKDLSVDTEVIPHRVTLNIAQLISKQHNIPMPAQIDVDEKTGDENIIFNKGGFNDNLSACTNNLTTSVAPLIKNKNSSDEAIGFWSWVKSNPKIPIIIAQGDKNANALLTAGYPAIALPRVWDGCCHLRDYSGKKTGERFLIPELEAFAQKGREIIFCYDNDQKPKTKKNVSDAIVITGELFEDKGCQVSFINWNHPAKGVDNLIVAEGAKYFHNLYVERKPLLNLIIANKNYLKWKKLKKFSANISFESPRFEYKIPSEGTITFCKGGTGVGKTHTTIKHLKQILKSEKRGAISLGYRNTLLLQFCAKTAKESIGFYHLHEDNAKLFTADLLSYIAACINSVIHFNPEDFDGKILILDELSSVLKHLYFSGTIKSLSRVRDLFEEAIKRASRVICLDAFMADWMVKFFKRICPDKKTITIENTFKGKKPKTYFLEGTIDEKLKKSILNDKTPWLKQLLDDSGLPVICSDSQIFIEALDNILLEQGRKTFRVDSKTAATNEVKEFLKDPSKYLQENEIEVLLYTPTAESGLDVPLVEYFTEHLAFFFGVLDVDSIMQMLGRIRDFNVPRYVWVRKFVPQDFTNTDRQSIDINKIAAERYAAVMQEIELALNNSTSPSEEIRALLEAIYRKNHDPHCEAADTIKAIWNFEKANLRDCVRENLIENGYQLESVMPRRLEDEERAGINDLEKEAKTEVKLQNSRDIYNASDRRSNDTDLSLAFDASWAERCEVELARICQRLPGIREFEYWSEEFKEYLKIWQPWFIKVIKYDRHNLIKELELLWLLKHPDVAKKMALESYHRLFERDKRGERIAPWKLRQKYLKITVLLEIGILKLLEKPNEHYTKKHKLIREIHKKGSHPDVVRMLGNPGKDPMKYVGRLLRSMGLNWEKDYSKTNDGKSLRHYKVNIDLLELPENKAILESLSKKYQKYLQPDWQSPQWELSPENASVVIGQKNTPQNHTEQGLQPDTLEPISYINNHQGSVSSQNGIKNTFEKTSDKNRIACHQENDGKIETQSQEEKNTPQNHMEQGLQPDTLEPVSYINNYQGSVSSQNGVDTVEITSLDRRVKESIAEENDVKQTASIEEIMTDVKEEDWVNQDTFDLLEISLEDLEAPESLDVDVANLIKMVPHPALDVFLGEIYSRGDIKQFSSQKFLLEAIIEGYKYQAPDVGEQALANSFSSPLNNFQVSSPGGLETTTPNSSSKLVDNSQNLSSLASLLADCESPESLAKLKQTYKNCGLFSRRIFNEAAKLLPRSDRERLKEFALASRAEETFESSSAPVEKYDRSDYEYLATNIERIDRGEVFLLPFLSQFPTRVLEKVWEVLEVDRGREVVDNCLAKLRSLSSCKAQFLARSCLLVELDH